MRFPWQKKQLTVNSLVGSQFDEFFGRTSGVPGVKTRRAALESYRGWVFDAVNLISNRVSTAELELFTMKGEEEIPVTAEQFKFLHTWQNPNPLFSGRMLREVVQVFLDLTGEGYILKVKDNMGFPKQLWPIRPDTIELKMRDGIYYFDHQSQHGKRRLELDDIIYLRYADPRNPLRGYSPFMASGIQYDVDMSVDSYQKTMFEEGAYFHYALSTDQSMTEPQIKYMREGWYNTVKNLKDKFKPPILQKGLKPFQLLNALDPGTDKTSNAMRDKILAAYGVPKALLGMLEGIQRANLEGTEYVFAKNQLEPRLDTWVDALRPTLQALDPRIQVRFKSTVPLDRKLRREDAESMQGMGALSVEETREIFGYNPEFRQGDTVLVPFNMMAVPQGGVAIDDKTVPTAPKVGTIFALNVGTPAVFTKSFWTTEKKDLYQKQFEDETEARERRWMPPIKRWADKWEKVGLKIIQEEVKSAADKYAGWGIARVRADYVAKAEVPEAIVALILDSSGKLHTVDFKESANEALAFVGVTDPFNMENPTVIEFLKTKTRKLTDEISLGYASDIEKILQEGIAAGQPVAEITETFQKLMGWESEGYRAERIARTEVLSVSNKARREAYEEANVPKKSWSSARDIGSNPNARADHYAYDVETSANPIPMSEEFEVVPGVLGDPVNTGQAEHDINCRCTLRPERDEG